MAHDNCLGKGCKECLLERKGIKKVAKKRTSSHLRNNSKAQERDLGKSYREAGFPEARRVPGSGSIQILPGDVENDWFLGEAKMTRTGRLIIQPLWIKKIRKQAEQKGKPWWVLHTWTAEGEENFTKCVTTSEEIWFEIMRRLKAAEDELDELSSVGVSIASD